jgi:tryptophan synthase
MGVTGATGTMNAALPEVLERVHRYSGNIPAAVGFGVSTRDHFLSVSSIAEGVVIGSQIITTLANAPTGQGAKKVQEYCSEITGRTGKDSSTREFGIIETMNGAKEPNGVTVDKVIHNGENGHGKGLVDQLEALNTNGHVDPAVSLIES